MKILYLNLLLVCSASLLVGAEGTPVVNNPSSLESKCVDTFNIPLVKTPTWLQRNTPACLRRLVPKKFQAPISDVRSVVQEVATQTRNRLPEDLVEKIVMKNLDQKDTDFQPDAVNRGILLQAGNNANLQQIDAILELYTSNADLQMLAHTEKARAKNKIKTMGLNGLLQQAISKTITNQCHEIVAKSLISAIAYSFGALAVRPFITTSTAGITGTICLSAALSLADKPSRRLNNRRIVSDNAATVIASVVGHGLGVMLYNLNCDYGFKISTKLSAACALALGGMCWKLATIY